MTYLLLLILLSSGVSALFSTDFLIQDFDSVIGAADDGNTWSNEYWQSYYLENLQGNECADSMCSAVESANELECKCDDLSPGEMCFDIFVKSTASETGYIMASTATDYCLDNESVMEGFVNCALFDNAYWAEIACPAGFMCFNGACIFHLNTSIGVAKNLTIADNGTIIHADYITINGVVFENISNVVLGANDSIATADYVIMNNLILNNITGIHVENVSSIDIEEAQHEELIIQDAEDINIWFDDVMRIDRGTLDIINPIDDSLMRFVVYDNMTIDYEETIVINATSVDVIIGLQIPSPPFVRIYGNESLISIRKVDSFIEYNISNAWFVFDGGVFREKVWSANSASILVSYQSGIICAVLSKGAHYSYYDVEHAKESYRILNRYQDKYVYCPRPESYEYDGKSSSGKRSLNSPIVYQRFRDQGFIDIYDTQDNSSVDINVGNLEIRNPELLKQTITHAGDFIITEDGNRYVTIESCPLYILEYSELLTETAISVDKHILTQKSAGNTVTVNSKP